jgi:hypothetical protein
MEGITPNAPPPKGTEVKLTKWEYSDPVGVPHPDTVDVLFTLSSDDSEALLNAEVRLEGSGNRVRCGMPRARSGLHRRC